MTFFPSQKKPLLVGFGLLLAAASVIVLIWLGTYLPGGFGEFFSLLAGIMWTPVLLDISLFLLGLIIVLWLNKYRLEKDGDEYVYLEQIDGPDLPGDLPAEARSAVYTSAPESLTEDPATAAIEGALSLGDNAEATRLLLALPSEKLETIDVLTLRIRLAQNSGKEEEARSLLEKLRSIAPHHSLLQ